MTKLGATLAVAVFASSIVVGCGSAPTESGTAEPTSTGSAALTCGTYCCVLEHRCAEGEASACQESTARACPPSPTTTSAAAGGLAPQSIATECSTACCARCTRCLSCSSSTCDDCNYCDNNC